MGKPFLIMLVSALVLVLEGPFVIPLLKRLKFGQTIRTDGPKRHLAKGGTPTMGGLMFLPALLITILIFGNNSMGLWLAVFSFLGFGALGLWDDLLKIVFHRSLGLTMIQKLIGQFIIIAIILCISSKVLGRGTDILFPGGKSLDLGWLYYPIVAVFLVYMVNAVNLTDGLDGLASGISVLVFLGFGIIAMAAVNAPLINGVDYYDLVVFAFALSGACLGFLLYNKHPAKVFMGDTGSLAIGGALAALAVLTKMEFLYIILGGVFLVEALSVVLQVFSFKVFHKRIFKMSPLHHHFEMIGWPEPKVVLTFWFAAAVCVIIAILLLAI